MRGKVTPDGANARENTPIYGLYGDMPCPEQGI